MQLIKESVHYGVLWPTPVVKKGDKQSRKTSYSTAECKVLAYCTTLARFPSSVSVVRCRRRKPLLTVAKSKYYAEFAFHDETTLFRSQHQIPVIRSD